MKYKTKKAFSAWISGVGPESANFFDEERFNNAVYESIKEGDVIDEDDLNLIIKENTHIKWNEDSIINFCEQTCRRIDAIIHFLDFLKSKKGIDVYQIIEE